MGLSHLDYGVWRGERERREEVIPSRRLVEKPSRVPAGLSRPHPPEWARPVHQVRPS